MRLSLAPILVAVELGFFFFLAWRCRRGRGGVPAIWIYLLWVTSFAIAASLIGASGFYVSDELLRWLPGLWLPLVIVPVCVLPVLMSRQVRDGLRDLVDSAPWHWFAYFHTMRIAGLGTAYKTGIGEFPVSFEVFVGIPDLVFALSAFWIAARARRGTLEPRLFLSWNLLGALVIVPAAPIVLQLGLPGPLQVFTSQPDARAVITYPMSIAPTVGVPLFVLVNTLVAWRLWEIGRANPREART